MCFDCVKVVQKGFKIIIFFNEIIWSLNQNYAHQYMKLYIYVWYNACESPGLYGLVWFAK
jgi:hypothetical protein